VYCME